MSSKHIVVHQAKCKCKYSVEPKTDELVVKSHKKHYANDNDEDQKLIGTTKELGQTLKKNSFGKCKLQPTSSDFLPCQAVITQWSNFYEKVVLSNGGKILTEDSKATCPIGGPDCISIDHHGQKAKGSKQDARKSNDEVNNQLNPAMDNKEFKEDMEQNEIIVE
jgi:hypothetical protein